MNRRYNDFEQKIELKLKNHLSGKSITEWCKSISNQYLFETNQIEPPFSIKKYLPIRKIHTEHDSNISVTGQIKPTDSGFLLKINPEKIKSEQYYNLTLAHEIAHTFFYNTNDKDTKNLLGLTPGSKYLEYLCRKLARFLIIPSISIEKEILKYPNILSKDFNLSIVNDLMHKYRTSAFVLLTRLISDEIIWDALFLRFQFYNNIWRLKESFKQSGIFLPPPNSRKTKSDPERYPSAKKKLDEFLNNIWIELKEKKRVSKEVKISELNDKPLVSLFNELDENELVLVHFSLDRINNLVNIFIPLNQKPFC